MEEERCRGESIFHFTLATYCNSLQYLFTGRTAKFAGTCESYEPEQTPFTAVNWFFTLTEAGGTEIVKSCWDKPENKQTDMIKLSESCL